MGNYDHLLTLISDRVSKKERRVHRHVLSLRPSLYADLDEAYADLDALGDPEKDTDKRLNGPRVAIHKRIADIERQIKESSLVAVFTTEDPQKWQDQLAEWDRATSDAKDKDKTNPWPVFARAKALIVRCFTHFNDDTGKPIPADVIGVDQLEGLLSSWSEGEIYGLSNKLTDLMSSDINVPKSVRQSLLYPTSDAT